MTEKHSLKNYINVLKEAGLFIAASDDISEEMQINGLTFDSKAATPGTLFVCKGAAFKEAYLEDAKERGASVYVSEIIYENVSLPYIQVSDIRVAMPYLSELFFNSPEKMLHLTGVGGTKGKSTTAYYIKSVLDEYLSSTGGKESAVISSIDVYDGVERYESHITTPENIELLSHFDHAATTGIKYLTMEVSSQALKYDRVDLINFDVGIFLNISEDHISPIEHPDFEDYFSSKLRLFSQTKNALICTNADNFDRIREAANASQTVMTFGTLPESDIYGYDIKKVDDEIRFRVRFKRPKQMSELLIDDFDEPFVLTMPGLFNVENALAAIGTSIIYGIPYEIMYSGLKKARSSGRMEAYTTKDKKVISVVDYAHNKLSFEKLFSSTKEEYPDYDIIAIFGCPGKKALVRRRDLGTIAGQYSKKVYIVAEDPGAEPYIDIAKDIAQYVEAQGCPYEMIEDRGNAIRDAIMSASGKTIILITGKGNETRQKYGTQYIDCPSDVEFTKRYIAEYDARASRQE